MSEVYDLQQNSIVRGHFQCEKYFIDYRNDVLLWFELKDEVRKKASELMEEIKKQHPGKKTISIHLRRGFDYLRENRLIKTDYYIRAIEALCDMTGLSKNQFVAIIFSDCNINKRLLNKFGCEFHIANGTLFDDFALMQICEYHIVSNSSFAWWGAWLDKKDTLIIRPSIYPISKNENYPDDVFPTDWVIVEAKPERKPITLLFKKVQKRLNMLMKI